MSYSNRGMGVGPFLMNPDAEKAPAPSTTSKTTTSTATTSASTSGTVAPVKLTASQTTAMQLTPVQSSGPVVLSPAQQMAMKMDTTGLMLGPKPESLLTAECADYRYVVNFKPIPRTGILPAGTPMVGGVKISWDPSVVGVDFPQSWVAWRNGNAGAEQVDIDAATRAGPHAPGIADARRAADAIDRAIAEGARGDWPSPAVLTGGKWPRSAEPRLTQVANLFSTYVRPGETLADAGRRKRQELASISDAAARWRAPIATSTAYLTTATRAFLIGFAPQGPNSAVLFVGAVSSRDVDMDSMMGFLKRLLFTNKNVQGGGFGLMAFAVVPKLKAGQVGVAAPSKDYVAYQDRIPGYSVEDARAMAIAAALSKREALQVMISGEIFGGLTVAKSPDLFIQGEAAVKAAVESVAKAATLAEVTTGVAGLASGAVAEAEAAKSLPQEEGDAACAAILDRLAAARDSINTAMSAELAKLAAGPAALASAQQAVANFTAKAHGAEEEVRRLVAERIAAWEAKPSFKALSPEEQFAVRCIMQQKAAPLVAKRTEVANSRITMISSIKTDEFNAAVAAATQAYTAAQATATAAINDAIAKVEEVRRIIGLPFYMKSFYGLPVWAWGAGGAALLVGGAVFIRSRRKKAAASAGQK